MSLEQEVALARLKKQELWAENGLPFLKTPFLTDFRLLNFISVGVTRLLSEPAGLGNHRPHVRLVGAASTPAGSSSPGRGLLVPTAAYPQSENSHFNLGEGEAAADPHVARSAQGRCRYCQDFKVCSSQSRVASLSQCHSSRPLGESASFSCLTHSVPSWHVWHHHHSRV